MMVIRKVFVAGTSKVVALPSDWIRFQERKIGHRLTEVEIEMEGEELRINPAGGANSQ